MGVVIVTYASADDIGHALNALPTAELARVVVVDNASPDDTVAVMRALDLPNVEIVEQANVGFGAGNDAGRARLPTGTELVLFLNPDCVIEAKDIGALVAYLDAHARCGLVGPKLRVSETEPLTPGGALPTVRTELQPHLPRQLGKLLPRRQLEPDAEWSGTVGYVEGACMLMRTAALDDVGGFDHRYFLCFEEIDLAHRLHDAGWTVDVCPTATATHARQRSRAQRPLFSQYHQYRSQRLYLERWFGPRAANRYARFARASWWVRSLSGRLTKAEYRVRAAAVSGADLPE